MKTMAGQNNLLITWRPTFDGAALTRVETADREITLPETVEGLPVTALGSLAFDLTEPPPPDTPLRITCGLGGTEADNRKLERITLPATLRRVGSYAFYNCSGLREVRFLREVDDWGTSPFMNCLSLNVFRVQSADDRAENVYHLVNAFSRELDVTVDYAQVPAARLIFPAYTEAYQENISARCFDYALMGPGYLYRNVFRRRALPLKDYDRLWPTLIAMEHDPDGALRMAWHRLRYPRALTPEAGERYLGHLRQQAGAVIDRLLHLRDMRGLAWFLPQSDADRETLAAACESARQLGAAEALALLLAEQHRRFSDGIDKSFAL